MVFPPVFDLIKKKVLGKDEDTPEATLSTLATSKPEIMPQYVEALAKLEEAQVKNFQRDVAGEPAKWVSTLRAAIRPLGTTMALFALILCPVMDIPLDEPTRITLELIVGSWFGTRISLSSFQAQPTRYSVPPWLQQR